MKDFISFIYLFKDNFSIIIQNGSTDAIKTKTVSDFLSVKVHSGLLMKTGLLILPNSCAQRKLITQWLIYTPQNKLRTTKVRRDNTIKFCIHIYLKQLINKVTFYKWVFLRNCGSCYNNDCLILILQTPFRRLSL